MKLLIRILIFSVIVSIFSVRCANRAAPEGGPIDSTAPMVIRTSPELYATNFSGQRIYIEFDEYVQLKEHQKLFFVSPPRNLKPLLTIKNRGVEVLFEDPLDSATTYRLDFGSSIADNNEGNKLEGYTFTFSTGDHIDSLAMVGQTLAAYERDSIYNAYIFFFDAKVDTAKIDSVIFNAQADALFRTDSSGYFIADILKDKEYIIYALDDKNGDQKYQAGTDRIGFSPRTYNPTQLKEFTLYYDSLKGYVKIDPLQVKFDLFEEIPIRRQMILTQERPMRQKLLLTFNSPHPTIDSIEFEGIQSEWIIRENGLIGDSVILWIAPPTKEDIEALIDTLKGSILLEKEDSVWVKYSEREKIVFTHKIILTDKEQKDVKKDEVKEAKEKKKKDRQRLKRRKKAEKERRYQERQFNKRIKQLRRKKELQLVDSLLQADSLQRAKRQERYDSIQLERENRLAKIDSTGRIASDSLIYDPETGEVIDSITAKEPEKSKLKFSVIAESTLNPENHIKFEFDYPILTMDTTLMKLTQFRKTETRGRTTKVEIKEQAAKFTISNHPDYPRQWFIRSDWRQGDEYHLTILPGAFEDITFEKNDSLTSKFTVAHPDKFGKLIILPTASKADSSLYIYELVQGMGNQQKAVARKKGVKPTESVTFAYLKEGTYLLRIVQDRNHNGKWDTGSLTDRRHPEKVRMVTKANGEVKEFLAKENWEVEEAVDLTTIFEEQ